MTATTGLTTTTQPPVTNLIKADALGRARRTREHRERILDEYEHSGLSGVKFAALCGVSEDAPVTTAIFCIWTDVTGRSIAVHVSQ